jgi:molybdopterin synthase catalytic subunit
MFVMLERLMRDVGRVSVDVSRMADAMERFSLDHAEAVHRVGKIEIEETAVIVVVSAPHRTEAFDACRFIIDEIKHRVPIWKKEFYADGSSAWVGCEGCRQAHQH